MAKKIKRNHENTKIENHENLHGFFGFDLRGRDTRVLRSLTALAGSGIPASDSPDVLGYGGKPYWALGS